MLQNRHPKSTSGITFKPKLRVSAPGNPPHLSPSLEISKLGRSALCIKWPRRMPNQLHPSKTPCMKWRRRQPHRHQKPVQKQQPWQEDRRNVGSTPTEASEWWMDRWMGVGLWCGKIKVGRYFYDWPWHIFKSNLRRIEWIITRG